MHFLKHFLFFPFIFCFYANLLSQTDSVKSYQLSDVVVTATRTQMPLIEVASSISIIDSEEIASSKKTSVFDLLKNQYGLSFTQQGGAGMLANVFLRGGEAGHSLILIDGVEVNMPNDPDNAFDFSYLSTGNIDRIEVLRGPQSVLYGSNALSGVINIITKQGAGKPKLSLITEGGSYNSANSLFPSKLNTYRASAAANGGYNFLSYSVSLGGVKTDGISTASEKFGNTEKDGYSTFDIASRLGMKILDELSLNFIYRFTKGKFDNDQFGGRFGDDPTYIFDLEESLYKTDAELNLFKGVWKQSAAVSFFRNLRKYNYDSTLFNPFYSRSRYDGWKLKFEWQNELNFSKWFSAVFGVESENEEAMTEYYSDNYASSYSNVQPFSNAKTTGIYLQNQFNLNNNYFVSIGGRFDKHDLFAGAFTYRIAPAYVFWQTGTKIKATFGTGFRAPSLYNLFNPAFGNRNLNPEKSIGWDAGIEQFFFDKKINLGITYFSNSFKDLFGLDSLSRTINTDKAETAGIELFFSAEPFDKIKLKANYSFTHTEDKSENSPDKGKELLRRPKHKAGLSINYWFINNADVNVEIIYVGKSDDIDFSSFERVVLKDYTLVNVALSYKLFNFAEIFGRIENLFDTDYEEVFGYGTAGLSGYAGIKLTF